MNSLTEHKSRIYTLVGVALAMFVGALDQTIVSTATPRLVADLGGIDRYTWVTTIYLLLSTILVPIIGKLADIMSRKTLELWSVGVFLLGSVLCGLSGEFGNLPLIGDGMNQMILFRGVQAIGGAGIFALAFIIISDLYPPRERGKIAGVFGAVFGLSSVLGPVLGGFLTDHASGWIPGIEGWRWVFYVNVPVGAVALWFIVAKMPRLHPHDHSHKINLVSTVLLIAAFVPILLGLQLNKELYPWSSPTILILLIGGVVVLGLWIGHTLHTKNPLLNLKLFRNPVFAFSNLAQFFYGAAFLGILVFLPLYMVQVQGVSATKSGVSLIPLSMGIILGAGIGGPLVSRIGRYKGVMIVGSITAIAAAVLMYVILGLDTPYGVVIVLMVAAGAGFGPAQSLYSLAIQNVVDRKEMGQATSASQFSRQIGSTIGVAILGTVFGTALATGFSANMPASLGAVSGGQAVFSSGESSGQLSSRSTEEVRSGIIEGFDGMKAELTRVFALRGEEAKTGLERLLATPGLPRELTTELAAGTPAMAVQAGFTQLLTALEEAILAGRGDAVRALLTQGPAAGALPPQQVNELVRLAASPRSVRERALPGVRAGLEAAAAQAADVASAAALQAIATVLDEQKVMVADQVVYGIRKSFNDAIHRLWFISILIMVAALVFTVLIPDVPLRGKGEAVPGSTEEPAAPGAGLAH